jgi:hypothetical protein
MKDLGFKKSPALAKRHQSMSMSLSDPLALLGVIVLAPVVIGGVLGASDKVRKKVRKNLK